MKISEIGGICITRKILENKDKRRIVILLIAIHPNVRKCGYGTIFMDELIDYLNRNKKIELILHSLKESINFYLKYGFEEMNSNRHKFILNYEGLDKEKEEIKLFKFTTKNHL